MRKPSKALDHGIVPHGVGDRASHSTDPRAADRRPPTTRVAPRDPPRARTAGTQTSAAPDMTPRRTRAPRAARDRECFRVGCERARRAAEQVARELVERDHQRQRGQRPIGPGIEPTGRGRLVGGEEPGRGSDASKSPPISRTSACGCGRTRASRARRTRTTRISDQCVAPCAVGFGVAVKPRAR